MESGATTSEILDSTPSVPRERDRGLTLLAAAAVLAVALVLRLWGLGWLPSAAGDEGNWTLLALGILKGEPVALPPDAAFVTLLYAHVMAVSMKLFGLGFGAARLPNALAGAITAFAAYGIFAGLGSRAGGLVSAVALAVHPWSVCYSRISSCPYALALFTMTVGPLLFVVGVLRRKPFLVAAGILVTGVGAHFSPLCAIAAAACGLFVLPAQRRWVLRSWPVGAALLVTVAHALTVVPGILRASALADDAPAAEFSRLGWRVWNYSYMIGTGLAGEATLRHFTSHALPPWPSGLLVIPSAGVVLAAAMPAVRSRSLLAGFAPLYFVTGLVLVPFILAPGRDWHLPYNHSDRYLFAVLPAFVLCLAELAHIRARLHLLLVAFLIAWMAAGTLRLAHTYLRGGGVDHGEMIFDGGGGYRGWLVSNQRRNTLLQIRDQVRAETGTSRAVLLTADRVFIPMDFVLEGTGIPVFNVRRGAIPPGFQRYFLLLWPDSVLSIDHPPTAPSRYVGGNQRLRLRVERIFRHRQLIRRFVQMDGSPLLELWMLEQPGPGLGAPD
jgi:hypothetical protein